VTRIAGISPGMVSTFFAALKMVMWDSGGKMVAKVHNSKMLHKMQRIFAQLRGFDKGRKFTRKTTIVKLLICENKPMLD
jgi:hypothetical protein